MRLLPKLLQDVLQKLGTARYGLCENSTIFNADYVKTVISTSPQKLGGILRNLENDLKNLKPACQSMTSWLFRPIMPTLLRLQIPILRTAHNKSAVTDVGKRGKTNLLFL